MHVQKKDLLFWAKGKKKGWGFLEEKK